MKPPPNDVALTTAENAVSFDYCKSTGGNAEVAGSITLRGKPFGLNIRLGPF